MSLRGSETTEAISQGADASEIATLPSVARNDRKGIATESSKGEELDFEFYLNLEFDSSSVHHFVRTLTFFLSAICFNFHCTGQKIYPDPVSLSVGTI